MNNPNKQWSWGAAMGRALGSAIGAGSAGFVAGSLGGVLGAPLTAAIGAGGGFIGGFTGTALGYWWDKPAEDLESLSSAALYCTVVVDTLCSLLYAMVLPYLNGVSGDQLIMMKGFGGFALLSGLLGAASRSLIDDMRVATRREADTVQSTESTPTD